MGGGGVLGDGMGTWGSLQGWRFLRRGFRGWHPREASLGGIFEESGNGFPPSVPYVAAYSSPLPCPRYLPGDRRADTAAEGVEAKAAEGDQQSCQHYSSETLGE